MLVNNRLPDRFWLRAVFPGQRIAVFSREIAVESPIDVPDGRGVKVRFLVFFKNFEKNGKIRGTGILPSTSRGDRIALE
jgi:hypothetical protein